MAQDCTIPCNARALQGAIHRRLFGDETFNRLPVIAGALALGIISPVVIVFAPAITGIVLAGWFFLGAAIAVGQAWLSAGAPARQAMPGELVRLVEANAGRIHSPRTAALRERAAALSLNEGNFATQATRLLQELREATGEAWRCPCRKRRLPIPIPLPF